MAGEREKTARNSDILSVDRASEEMKEKVSLPEIGLSDMIEE